MSDALLGVIIGGSIAILPPIFTSIFQSIRETKREKINNKRNAYDKIVRYLFYTLNWDPKINKRVETYAFTEEAVVLSTLYCSLKLQNLIRDYHNLFNEYSRIVNKGKQEDIVKTKQELRDLNIKIRSYITFDVGGKSAD